MDLSTPWSKCRPEQTKNLGEAEGWAYFYKTCATDFERVAVGEVSLSKLRSVQALCSLSLCGYGRRVVTTTEIRRNTGDAQEISMKIIVSIFITFASVLTALAQQAQLDTLRAEGYEALYNLDYEGARRRFQKMVELAPEDPAGAQCLASSLWLQQLNESYELKATLYSG